MEAKQAIPFFAYSPEVQRFIYTTNAIESLNSKLRTAVRSRGHLPNDESGQPGDGAVSKVDREQAAQHNPPDCSAG
jgi:transposase-like protein